jgi:hypothetical protein
VQQTPAPAAGAAGRQADRQAGRQAGRIAGRMAGRWAGTTGAERAGISGLGQQLLNFVEAQPAPAAARGETYVWMFAPCSLNLAHLLLQDVEQGDLVLCKRLLLQAGRTPQDSELVVSAPSSCAAAAHREMLTAAQQPSWPAWQC